MSAVRATASKSEVAPNGLTFDIEPLPQVGFCTEEDGDYFIIGEATREKFEAQLFGTTLHSTVKGRDLVSGLPRDLVINSNEIAEALNPNLLDIAASVQNVFNNTPPELVADIMEKGIIISGGGGHLRHVGEIVVDRLGGAGGDVVASLTSANANGTVGQAVDQNNSGKKNSVDIHVLTPANSQTQG